jgi:hypothetical protein
VAWRVIVAGAIAITPGMIFWSLVLGLPAIARRLRHRHGLTEPTGNTART